MTDESVQFVNKPAFLEVSDGEVLISIATNIPTELSPTSPVLPKTPTMEHTFEYLHQCKNWKRTLLRIMILKTSSIKT